MYQPLGIDVRTPSNHIIQDLIPYPINGTEACLSGRNDFLFLLHVPVIYIICRYYTPADDELDEDTRRVQEAAGAALSEANERLMEAEMKLQAAQVCH